MARRTLTGCAALLGAMLLIPAAAQARPAQNCWCQVFTDHWSYPDKKGYAMRHRTSRVMELRGVNRKKRAQVKGRIYDWSDNGALEQGYCKRHPKVCRAAAACLGAAGSYLAGAIGDGRITRAEFIQSAGVCGAAAATALAS